MSTSMGPSELRGVDGCHPYSGAAARALAEQDRRAKIRALIVSLDWIIAGAGVCAFFALLAWIA